MSRSQAPGMLGQGAEPAATASASIHDELQELLARLEDVLARQGHLAATVAAFDIAQLQALNDAVTTFVESNEQATTLVREHDRIIGRLSARLDVVDSAIGARTAGPAPADEAANGPAASPEVRALLDLAVRHRTDRTPSGLLGWIAAIGFGSVLDLGGTATYEAALEAMEDARGSSTIEEPDDEGSD